MSGYTGTLTLEWYNSRKSIILDTKPRQPADKEAPQVHWVNQEGALFYKIAPETGRGERPFWVQRDDIRVREIRPLLHQKTYHTTEQRRADSLLETEHHLQTTDKDRPAPNQLIQGDNLLTLNTLRQQLAGQPDEEKVKCIYIDPPYNTGSAFKKYDDHLEHSEWLTLMRDRLAVLRDLLRPDGSIWISLDDHELHYCKALCDQIFGRQNFIATIIWEKRFTRENRRVFSFNHDYLLVYAYEKDEFEKTRNPLPLTPKIRERYRNPDNDPRGPWQSVSANAMAGHATKDQFYTLETPSGRKLDPPPGRCWLYSKTKMLAEIQLGNIHFPKDGDGVPRIKKFLSTAKLTGVTPETLWFAEDVGTTDSAKKHAHRITADSQQTFDTPKPEQLLQRVIEIATNPGDIVLDCFAGSGTTCAVAHKMNRRWIAVEIGAHARTHIIPRMQQVLTGADTDGISEAQHWHGGGAFRFLQLGPSLISQENPYDFNWPLGRETLEETLLNSYQFQKPRCLPNATIARMQGQGDRSMTGIASLAEPGGRGEMMTIIEFHNLLEMAEKADYTAFFTNRGIELSQTEKPENVEIIKVPQALLAR